MRHLGHERETRNLERSIGTKILESILGQVKKKIRLETNNVIVVG